jgi:hypothetical protein
MTSRWITGLVRRWVRSYTRGLPPSTAARRVEEIDADLYDHIAHAREAGQPRAGVALDVLSRMVRGLPADIAWRRHEQQRALAVGPSARGGSMITNKTAYRIAAVIALGTALLLVWGVSAMGVIGAEGDPFDLLYIAVLAVGLIGAVLVRFRPEGMVLVLVAMAVTQALIALIGLAIGKQDVPVSSVAEILYLNGFFVALFLGSAWLFRHAARGRPTA